MTFLYFDQLKVTTFKTNRCFQKFQNHSAFYDNFIRHFDWKQATSTTKKYLKIKEWM